MESSVIDWGSAEDAREPFRNRYEGQADLGPIFAQVRDQLPFSPEAPLPGFGEPLPGSPVPYAGGPPLRRTRWPSISPSTTSTPVGESTAPCPGS